jgi:peptidoglycan/xylan/chitin deacetylase (PgdA/CDA1 family)
MDTSLVLRSAFDAIYYSGAAGLLRPYTQGVGAIFCLHHVCPGGGRKTGFSPNYQLEISPEFLDETITLCRKRGYELLSLAAAVERLRQGGRKAPFAVFTLDDGYRDNATHAAPVFRKHNCPYTIFVAPRIAEGTCELWWRALELMIADTRRIELDLDGQKVSLPTTTDAEKNSAWKVIFPLVKAMPEHRQREWINAEADRRELDLKAYCRSVAMSWQEISELNRDPLCTIGAHTMNHYAVSRLTVDEALHELKESRRIISDHLGETTDFFAYPYGDIEAAGPRDFALAGEAGFAASVTTRKGVVFAEHDNHRQAIPRIMLSGRYQKKRYVDTLLSGVPFGLLNGFRQVNVM